MTSKRESWQVHTWYGLPVEIHVDGDFWHTVRVGAISLPHPPVVNLLLRRGLPRKERLRLSYWHELGHVQVLPLALLYAVWLWQRCKRTRGTSLGARLSCVLAAMVTHGVAWELAAEGYAAARMRREYGQLYREHPQLLLAFWGGGMALLASSVAPELCSAAVSRERGTDR